MTTRTLKWLNCLEICLGFLVISAASADTLLGKVIAVHDGDTITLKNESGQMKIRLSGIDAPELNQPYGVESRVTLKEALVEKHIKVVTSKTDKYGRVVGKVTVDGQDINLRQIELGMAWVYRVYLKELSKVDQALYLELEAQSKAIAVGLWKDSNPIEPWIWRKK